MIKSSASTTGVRISAGSTDRPHSESAPKASTSKAKTAGFTPWILGFSGTRPPRRLLAAIHEGRICGLILFRDNLGGSVAAALALHREILSAVPSGRPFVFACDEEGGLISQTSGLDLPDGGVWPALPTPRALGRVGRPAETRWVGRILGRRLRQLGFRADLAPCLDLDTERENPVIGSRSFGAEPERVAEQGWAFALGLMDAGVVPCFKHYPGHGGTMADSHRTLPRIDPTHRSSHEMPFHLCLEWAKEKVVDDNSRSPAADPAAPSWSMPSPWIMPAHVDWGSGLPASLDPKVLRRLRSWNKSSLSITDALDMGAVALAGDAARAASLAGNDLLLVGRDWAGGLDALDRWERAGTEDAALRSAAARARRRVAPVWAWSQGPADEILGEGPWRLGSEDEKALSRLHRLCVRLDAAPHSFPQGGWVWVIPEGFHPYTRLRDWKPPHGRYRTCQEVIWVPEKAAARWMGETARRLRSEERPILLATLFRGRPAEAVREAWGAFLGLPRLCLVAHLLDEGWPEHPPATALTSGPSLEGLTALAEALDLPESAWNRAPEGLYFPVDSGPSDRVQ